MVQDKTDVRWERKKPSTSASLVHVCRNTLDMSGHLFINNNNMPEHKRPAAGHSLGHKMEAPTGEGGRKTESLKLCLSSLPFLWFYAFLSSLRKPLNRRSEETHARVSRKALSNRACTCSGLVTLRDAPGEEYVWSDSGSASWGEWGSCSHWSVCTDSSDGKLPLETFPKTARACFAWCLTSVARSARVCEVSCRCHLCNCQWM